MRIFRESEVLSQKIEKFLILLTFYTSCSNIRSVAPIVDSENCKNKKNNINHEEGTAESVKDQRDAARMTLIIQEKLSATIMTSLPDQLIQNLSILSLPLI